MSQTEQSDDRSELIQLINDWNTSRYELFAISEPNENLEFHGVIRFYFQEAGEKVTTKCVRVDSTSTTEDVIRVLVEKFRPDMKTLSSARDYAVYELHADAQERKLGATERPLMIQLEWGKDAREGRFLLKNENAKSVQFDTKNNNTLFIEEKKTRMSKREHKKLKKLLKASSVDKKPNRKNVAENLYKEVPDSTFTRSISNPEAVMARRRKQKLENKLMLIKTRDGGGTLKIYGESLNPDVPYKTLLMSNNDTAEYAVREILEKYGVPSSEADNYCLVLVIMPDKQEREKNGTQIKEIVLDDDQSPISVLMNQPPVKGNISYQIRRCTPQLTAARQAKKNYELQKQAEEIQQQQQEEHEHQERLISDEEINDELGDCLDLQNPNQNGTVRSSLNRSNTLPPRAIFNSNKFDPMDLNAEKSKKILENLQRRRTINRTESLNRGYNGGSPSPLGILNTNLPYLIEVDHESYSVGAPRIYKLKADFYEIGNDRSLALTNFLNYFLLDSTIPGIEKKHCAIKKSNDNLQLLLVPFAETYVNDELVKGPTQLFHNYTIRLGKFALFKVQNPNEAACNVIVANNDSQQQTTTTYLNNNHPKQMTATTPTGNVNILNGKQIMSNRTNGFHKDSKLINTNSLDSHSYGAKQPEGLPGLLEFPDDGEDALLSQICAKNAQTLLWPFKLAPVYTIYMMLRYRLSQKYKSDHMSFSDKMNSCRLLVLKATNYIREAIEVNHLDRNLLPYWLANASELLYFLKQDIHLSQISLDAQELLAESVEMSFKYLVSLMQQQLDLVLPAFLDPSDHVESDTVSHGLNQSSFDQASLFTANGDYLIDRPLIKHVIQILNETMNLVRMSRVNAALTIQLFAQLFHYINVRLFNCLINDHINKNGYISKFWGVKLWRRLNKIHVWSEKQGLELAADVHLAKIVQAAHFLKSPKHDINSLALISSNCPNLNSQQIRYLIRNYKLDLNEPPLQPQLCNNLISIAENTADQQLKKDAKFVKLDEDIDLNLPFLLPDDGYSCEIIKGLPTGEMDYLMNLQNIGYCWLWQNTQSPGNWKRYFISQQNSTVPSPKLSIGDSHSLISPSCLSELNYSLFATNEQLVDAEKLRHSSINQKLFQNTTQSNQMSNQQPVLMNISISKLNKSLGFSIVAGKPASSFEYGIYVKSVIQGGAAFHDGRLEVGDQILTVNNISLINVTQTKAADYLNDCGSTANLLISKRAAYLNGLDSLLLNDLRSPPPSSNVLDLTIDSHHRRSNLERFSSILRQRAQPAHHQSMEIPIRGQGIDNRSFDSDFVPSNRIFSPLSADHQPVIDEIKQRIRAQEKADPLKRNSDPFNSDPKPMSWIPTLGRITQKGGKGLCHSGSLREYAAQNSHRNKLMRQASISELDELNELFNQHSSPQSMISTNKTIDVSELRKDQQALESNEKKEEDANESNDSTQIISGSNNFNENDYEHLKMKTDFSVDFNEIIQNIKTISIQNQLEQNQHNEEVRIVIQNEDGNESYYHNSHHDNQNDETTNQINESNLFGENYFEMPSINEIVFSNNQNISYIDNDITPCHSLMDLPSAHQKVESFESNKSNHDTGANQLTVKSANQSPNSSVSVSSSMRGSTSSLHSNRSGNNNHNHNNGSKHVKFLVDESEMLLPNISPSSIKSTASSSTTTTTTSTSASNLSTTPLQSIIVNRSIKHSPPTITSSNGHKRVMFHLSTEVINNENVVSKSDEHQNDDNNNHHQQSNKMDQFMGRGKFDPNLKVGGQEVDSLTFREKLDLFANIN